MTQRNRPSTLRAVGMLACAALLVGACEGGERPAGNTPTPEDPAVVAASEPPQERGGYELSEVEERLIDAMAAAGVQSPGIDEKGVSTAIVSGEWKSRRAWVYATTNPEWANPGKVVDEVTVAGMAAKVVRTEHFGDVLTFSCGDVGYQVTVLGADWQVEDGSVDRSTTFAEALIPFLQCTG